MKTRKLLVLLLAIYLDYDDSNQGKDLDFRFLQERAIAGNLHNSSKQ